MLPSGARRVDVKHVRIDGRHGLLGRDNRGIHRIQPGEDQQVGRVIVCSDIADEGLEGRLILRWLALSSSPWTHRVP